MTHPGRILVTLTQAGVPLRTAQIAAACGMTQKAAHNELMRMRMLGRVDYVQSRHGKAWQPSTPKPSNVVPIRPAAKAPLRMLPVVRRDDCVHEPECSFAAAKAWPDNEGGLTCPVECSDYERAPRRAVSHPSNWMGGEG